MPRLIPCPSCQSHVFAGDRTCPHCSATLQRSSGSKSAAVLVGLALTGCPTVEPVYGVPESGTDTAGSEETSDTETGTDGGTDTDTDIDDTDTDTTGEPEYGVPDTGMDTTSTDGTDTSGGEPLYGVAESGD